MLKNLMVRKEDDQRPRGGWVIKYAPGLTIWQKLGSQIQINLMVRIKGSRITPKNYVEITNFGWE